MTIQSSSLSSTLAPGFRFHPTDDELVSYYLKRKKSNSPLLVDAISYIDLYKYEPWDLPSLSKLKTRDMEYYFFTTLDRKHDSRIRTSRRTLDGYWKTTGKDREVYGVGKVVVGMKKTLVYHSGRAPTGARSNWVMHEYRLNSDSSSTADDLQETLVLCRIFQKNGSGPQNGAQYGAPFREEEWAEGQGLGPKTNEGELNVLMHANNIEENQALADGQGSTDITANSEENVGSQPRNPSNLLELDEGINVPEPQVADSNIKKMYTFEEQVENHSGQKDGYLELKDFHNDDSFGQMGENYRDESTAVPQVDYASLYLDNAAENMNSNGLRTIDPSPISHDYHSAQSVAVDENIFFDAFSNNFSFTEDILDDMNNASGYDMVNDLFAYFDATENNLQNDMEIFNSTTTVQVNVKSEVDSGHVKEKGSSHSASSSENEALNKGNSATAEVQSRMGWKSAVKKQVVNMLGSISAPPAMAEECSTAIKAIPAPTSSIPATSGIIKIQNILLDESMDFWSTKKMIERSEFELSSYEPVVKRNGAFSTVLRCGFYLFGASVLIFSACLKIAMCLHNK